MNICELQPPARTLLLASAQTVRVARGAAVYLAGSTADRVYIVRSGRIKLVRTAASGAEAIIGIRNVGDLFGELATVDSRARTATAIAIEAVEADVIAVDAFTAALEANVELARAFARGVARRLSEAEHELAELMGKSVPGRLVDALGRLAGEHGVAEPDGTVRIGINLTHQDLADLIGTSRETLTKELNVLADVGLVRVSHKTVTLVQPRAFPYARTAAARTTAE